jgi:hypothetical protein
MKSPELNKNEKKILSALGRSEKPLSAYDILDRARSDALKAPVQVYRALEKLSSRGLVHRIEALNAFVACSDCKHPAHDHTDASQSHAGTDRASSSVASAVLCASLRMSGSARSPRRRQVRISRSNSCRSKSTAVAAHAAALADGMARSSNDLRAAAFPTSLMMWSAIARLGYAFGIIAGLWLAILWAVSLP